MAKPALYSYKKRESCNYSLKSTSSNNFKKFVKPYMKYSFW